MGTGVACFGELLLRLNAPGRELLLQSPRLDVYVGGAEANVAASLAHFGHSASVVSVVPDTSLGAACIAELRRHGVQTRHIRVAPGRIGLYFMAYGAGHRPSEIIYDRADSAFALHVGDAIDWETSLAGAAWLHVSGITAALGPRCAEAVLDAVRTARSLGVRVSFDSNVRAKLWEVWKGDPGRVLREVAEQSDLLFADERALSLMLARSPAEGDPSERFQRLSEEALATFSFLQRVATIQRVEHSVDRHELSAAMMSRDGLSVSRSYPLEHIVDRIGSGDAFAAGVLHGCLTGMDDAATLEFALAAACLKHTIPGDVNRVSVAHVQELLAGRGFAVRR
ncbi:MAG: sugar kinase [Steroidobacteraceae bacterium]|nr:sugar kinase [Steroidobacteraceae bacterium]